MFMSDNKLYPIEQMDKRIAYVYFLTTKINHNDFESLINSTCKEATFNDLSHVKNFMKKQFNNLISLDEDMKNCFEKISSLTQEPITQNNSNMNNNKKSFKK